MPAPGAVYKNQFMTAENPAGRRPSSPRPGWPSDGGVENRRRPPSPAPAVRIVAPGDWHCNEEWRGQRHPRVPGPLPRGEKAIHGLILHLRGPSGICRTGTGQVLSSTRGSAEPWPRRKPHSGSSWKKGKKGRKTARGLRCAGQPGTRTRAGRALALVFFPRGSRTARCPLNSVGLGQNASPGLALPGGLFGSRTVRSGTEGPWTCCHKGGDHY